MKNSYNCYKIAYRKKFLDKIVNIIELNNGRYRKIKIVHI